MNTASIDGTSRRVLVTIVAVVTNVAYFECLFVALVIQHARHMCHIMSTVAYSALPYLAHKRHDFRKNFTENRHCVLIFFSNLSEIFLVLSIIE
jgi:hypothetical protein